MQAPMAQGPSQSRDCTARAPRMSNRTSRKAFQVSNLRKPKRVSVNTVKSVRMTIERENLTCKHIATSRMYCHSSQDVKYNVILWEKAKAYDRDHRLRTSRPTTGIKPANVDFLIRYSYHWGGAGTCTHSNIALLIPLSLSISSTFPTELGLLSLDAWIQPSSCVPWGIPRPLFRWTPVTVWDMPASFSRHSCSSSQLDLQSLTLAWSPLLALTSLFSNAPALASSDRLPRKNSLRLHWTCSLADGILLGDMRMCANLSTILVGGQELIVVLHVLW